MRSRNGRIQDLPERHGQEESGETFSGRAWAAARKVYRLRLRHVSWSEGRRQGRHVAHDGDLRDWNDPASLEGKTDGENFYHYEGQGEDDGRAHRLPETTRWNMVNLVRSYSKKDAGDKPRLKGRYSD